MGLDGALSVVVFEWATGGGVDCAVPASWTLEGRAMRLAVANDFAHARWNGRPIRVTTPLDARLIPDPGPWETAPVEPGRAERVLERLAREVDCIVLIAPETNGVLAGLTQTLEQAPARLMGSTTAAVEITADKYRTNAALEAGGVPIAPARIVDPHARLPEDAPYPAVLKPIDGAGSFDTFLIAGPGDRPPVSAETTQAILQPFVAGSPMSAGFLVDPRGRASLIAVGRQRVIIQDNRFVYQGGELPVPVPEAEPALSSAIAAVPGLGGFVGVDFIWDPDRKHVVILEINPRPTTSYAGLARLLPKGTLASLWIQALMDSDSPRENPFAGLDRRPIVFAADGSIETEGGSP